MAGGGSAVPTVYGAFRLGAMALPGGPAPRYLVTNAFSTT